MTRNFAVSQSGRTCRCAMLVMILVSSLWRLARRAAGGASPDGAGVERGSRLVHRMVRSAVVLASAGVAVAAQPMRDLRDGACEAAPHVARACQPTKGRERRRQQKAAAARTKQQQKKRDTLDACPWASQRAAWDRIRHGGTCEMWSTCGRASMQIRALCGRARGGPRFLTILGWSI